MHVVHLTQHEIDEVVDFMRQASGNDFADKDALVNSKMSMLCSQAGYRHFYELWDAMQGSTIASARLRQKVIDELTTSYSYFYREQAHFAKITSLIAAGEVPVGRGGLRAWSAGCASGEEAFNLAMTFEDARLAGQLVEDYRIIGSDISEKAIEAASAARYDIANVARMPPHWRTRYCRRSGMHFDIASTIRNHVTFRRENVLAPRPDTPFDVVMCRNMIIYFDQESISRFCALLAGRVKPGGYLFLGHTEIMGNLSGFTYVEPSIWRRDSDAGNDLLSQLALR